MSRLSFLAVAAAAVVAGAGCAALPEPEAAPATDDVPPVVEPEQAQRVETAVAERVATREAAPEDAGSPEDAEPGLSGPARDLAVAGRAVGGEATEVAAREVTEPEILVAPRLAGWPRWFASVDDAQDADPDAEDAAVPVLRLYDSPAPREPYRLWGELTLLPGAVVPAFDAAELGAPVLAGEGVTSGVQPSGPEADPAADDDAPGAEDAEEDTEQEQSLQAAVAGLAERYADVLAEGEASEYAAQFEPDAFVPAVQARAEAEAAAVAAVADTATTWEPYEDGVQHVALTADGDALVVTAVTGTSRTTVRPGAGTLRLGPELAALAGVDETDESLTSTSVAALAFVVPAERGAIRLVALDEGLVGAETG